MMNFVPIVGIIAEYHPFHNGHFYQMRRALAASGARYCVVLLSGSFVQRGMPAMYSTHLRAEAALRCGADAVFELPSPFSSAAAGDYALCGVRMMSALGIPLLSCGTEDADADELMALAGSICQDSPVFRESIREALRNGLSYPEARLHAAGKDLLSKGASPPRLARMRELLSRPNNILAFEYAAAIQREQLPLRMLTVGRKGSGHHDPALNGTLASATAIRSHILLHRDLKLLKPVMPKQSLQLIQHSGFLSPDCMCGALRLRIPQMLYEGACLSDYADISPDLADRLASFSFRYRTYEEMISALKTKQYTYTRIARGLTHLLLGIKKRDMQLWKATSPAPYARLLGFRKESEELLTLLKQSASIPILSKAAKAGEILRDSPAAYELFRSEVHATALWNALCFEQNLEAPESLYRQQLIRV